MMNCKHQVTHKLSDPIGQMELESGPIGHMLKVYMTLKPSKSHRSDVEGPNRDFYDELQASS
jgi:hypothetical protein